MSPVVKKPVAKRKTVVKRTTKTAARKPLAKPVAKKTAVKPVAKRTVVKPVAKKAVVKPVAKKPVAKPVAQPAFTSVAAVKPALTALAVRPGLEGKTNQDVINIIYKAAEELGMPAWTLLSKAKLEHLVDARTSPYTGPAVGDLPDLTPDQRAVIARVLLSYVRPNK